MRFVAGFSLFVVLNTFVFAEVKNGFDITDASVPVDLIRAGGPPKDGIPAIDQPKFMAADEVNWLKPDDRVLGLVINGVVKAYPVSILNWHEIVNDELAGRAVVVSFCPLCGTGIAFDVSNMEPGGFGVSGLLFESDVLLYDRSSQSLWSQIWMNAVSGPKKGQKLKPLALDHTSWADWHLRHPETLVLTKNTGFSRDYSRNPYLGYESRERIYFPVQNSNDSFHRKSWVMGLVHNGVVKAYPFESLAAGPSEFNDNIGGDEVRVEFDEQNQTARILLDGQQLATVQSYWFAWVAFYPETLIYE